MGKVNREKSIIGRIDDMSRTLAMLLLMPILISLVLMLIYAGRYHSAIKRMETIASLRPMVAEEIPGAVWNLVSGRDTIGDSPVEAMLKEVTNKLDHLAKITEEENRLFLIVAGRTMETLEQYIAQIRDNLTAQLPVVQNEAILGEVRDVAALVDSMMSDYITAEIVSAARMNGSLWRVVLATASVETLVVLLALWQRGRAMRATAAFVSRPIERLEQVTSQLAEGKLDARLPDTDVCEMRNLTRQVNTMANHLESMMERSKRDEHNLRKAELRTLQAQINPHFLYNTLDAIVWKAEAGDKDEVIRLTSALSDFFRISLSSGADWIPISQEKKHIAGYLSIQKTRYRDILRYDIDIPDEIGQYYILKLLLQPLVENALYHGIKLKRSGGVIRVSAKLDEGWLSFMVSDTGYGMTQEQLEKLRTRMQQGQPAVSSGSGGFGLVNVNLRLRLYYNQPEGLCIRSGADGTRVSFRVPCRTEEEIRAHESISG